MRRIKLQKKIRKRGRAALEQLVGAVVVHKAEDAAGAGRLPRGTVRKRVERAAGKLALKAARRRWKAAKK